MPGLTCNSAVWNKVLYVDLLRQTLTLGMMTDYNAMVAFDSVLPVISIITCQHTGLPTSASHFMFHITNWNFIWSPVLADLCYCVITMKIHSTLDKEFSKWAALLTPSLTYAKMCLLQHTKKSRQYLPQLFQSATDDSTKWASLLWMLGGILNLSKCY